MYNFVLQQSTEKPLLKTKRILVYLPLLLRPTLIGILIGPVLWYLIFFRFGFHFLEEDESAFTDSFIPILAMFHAIVAGHVLAKVWDEYKTIRHCVESKDKDKFTQCKTDRIPVVIHMLLGSMSVAIQGMAMMLHFKEAFAGIIANFALAFVLALYWEVATNLDNPWKGVWYVNQIPKDWLDNS